jgi:hypothetical protein
MRDPVSLYQAVKTAQVAADVVTMRTLFTQDARMYEPHSGSRSGPEVAEFLGTSVGTEFFDLQFQPHSWIVQGNSAAIEWKETLRTREGVALSLEGCTVVEARGDQLCRWWEYIQPLRRKP